MNEPVEQQIRQILAAETSALALSNRLFAPGGLFSQLARSRDERRQVSRSPLFREAQKRLSQMERVEAAAFRSAVSRAGADSPVVAQHVKLERADVA